jgi:hypothetical protein
MLLEKTRVIDNISDADAATDSDDSDGDDNPSSDSSSRAGSGLWSAAAEEAALMERVKRATDCWPVITTTESPHGDQLMVALLIG